MAKTVLITGASRGIGRAAALLFGEKGWQVAVNYRENKAEAEKVARAVGGIAVQADISDYNQAEAMVQTVAERFGQIDVLVNNAGIAQQKLFTDITEQDWETMFNVNIKGMFHCTKAAVRDMIRRKQGSIINLSSIWGITGASCEVHYSASKAAVIGFTKALAKELGPSNITVNCVAPGVIATDMNANLDEEAYSQLKEETPLGRIGSPEEVAEAIFHLAAARFTTGQVISPNGGIVI